MNMKVEYGMNILDYCVYLKTVFHNSAHRSIDAAHFKSELKKTDFQSGKF